MNKAGEAKLRILRADYLDVTGKPFEHFYCPILHVDEAVELCHAHIVNQAFRSAPRRQTIQRKDVDGFFGSHFESDFITLQERGAHHPVDALADPKLARDLRPRIMKGDQEVEHFVARGPVPLPFTEATVESKEGPVRLGLKLHPSEVLAAESADWGVIIQRDLRLPALVSVLKAAHLTLFEILGYRYALSLGGYFVGHDALGLFFKANCALEHKEVIEAALAHFGNYANIVRPLLQTPPQFQGTISDGTVNVCMTGNLPWAMMVFVKAGNSFHAALIPVMEAPEPAAMFLRFMENPWERLEVRPARLTDRKWELSTEPIQLVWPPSRFIEPMGP